MKENRLTIYVSSPKSYEDVFDVFNAMFAKHWVNCPYHFFLSTNSRVDRFESLIGYCSNKLDDDWVERTIPSLEMIESQYVLLMCDDIFVSSTPNEEHIEKILDYMDENKINFCRIKPLKNGKRINDIIMLLSKKIPYAKNLQIGIFNRQYLLNELKEKMTNAWQIESDWNQEIQKCNSKFLSDIIGVRKIVIPFYHGVYKGKWIPATKRKIKKEGIVVNGERKTLSFFETLFVSLKNIGGLIIPFKVRKLIKRALGKLGVKFATKS